MIDIKTNPVLAAVILFLVLPTMYLWAATGGSISGVVADQSGAVVSGAGFKLVNTSQQTTYQAISDRQGLYSFPNLPVGHYDLTITASGFTAQKKTNLTVDTDSAIRLDVTLSIGARSDTMTVISDSGTQIETSATHLGEVVSGAQMTALPLNGRTYTDLLSIQPGVAPLSTLLPSSVIMAGVTGGIDPSGDANPGNLSINGQRESANGFIVNGIDVQEHMNGGTSIIPNLDSIDEFRVLTNNFDPEYGNYNGGMVTVVSKTGSNAFHGGAFEFFRNTNLDAKGYFDQSRAAFNQNQFGGTFGGPIPRDKIFFNADIREHEPLRAFRPETSRSRPWPSVTATLKEAFDVILSLTKRLRRIRPTEAGSDTPNQRRFLSRTSRKRGGSSS